MKMYSVFKVGVAGIILGFSTLSQAVIVSIDRYEAPNGRTIYLFGDAHIGNNELIQYEQDAFVAAARQKEAVCIVEDMMDYQGDNCQIREIIDNDIYSRLLESDDSVLRMSSFLFGLKARCVANNIICYNAECRHGLQLVFTNFSAFCQEYDRVLDDLRAYRDSPLLNICAKKGISVEIKMSLYKDTPIGVACCVADGAVLFDISLERILNNIIEKNDDKRDIFICAGAKHIEHFITYSSYGKYTKKSLDVSPVFEFEKKRLSLFVETEQIAKLCWGSMSADETIIQRRELIRERINTFVSDYRADIAQFFKLESGS